MFQRAAARVSSTDMVKWSSHVEFALFRNLSVELPISFHGMQEVEDEGLQ